MDQAQALDAGFDTDVLAHMMGPLDDSSTKVLLPASYIPVGQRVLPCLATELR